MVPVTGRRLLEHAPQLIFAVAAGILLSGLAVHWGDWPATAVVGAYLVWLLGEAPVTFRGPVAVRDVRTLLPYAAARFAAVGCGILLPAARPPGPVAAVAAVVFVTGILVRQRAIRVLGRFYSHHVARRTEQSAVTTGPYRLIRHPAYFGMLLAHVGFVGFFPNPFSALCLALLLAAVVFRIRVEERVLWDMPGYRGYATGRPRLVPGVW